MEYILEICLLDLTNRFRYLKCCEVNREKKTYTLIYGHQLLQSDGNIGCFYQ